jgi:hypothetical protein
MRICGALVALTLLPVVCTAAETASGTPVPPRSGDDIAVNNVFRPSQPIDGEGSGGGGDGQASHDNQDPAAGQQRSVVIQWPKPADIPVGTALSGAQLNAKAPVRGTFFYDPTLGTVLKAGANQKLSVTFLPIDKVHYKETTHSVSITVLAENGNRPTTTPVAKPHANHPAQ